MTIPRNLSFFAEGASSTGVLGVANGGSAATTLTGYLIGNGTSAFTASATIPTSNLSGTVSLTTQVSGTLPVGNGGTGLTTLTAGYIPFGNGTSAFGSNSSLFWDSANNRLGIGNALPSQKITVYGGIALEASATLPASTGSVWIFSNESPNKRMYIGDGTGYAFNFSKRTASTTTDVVTIADGGGVSSISTFTSTSNSGFILGSAAGYTKSFTRTQNSPYDQLNIISLGGSGGWQGAVNLQVSYNNGTPYTAMTVADTGTGTAAGSLTSIFGNLSVTGTVKTGGYTVAGLPAGVTGARVYVTDALAPSYGATVVGGGSVTIPVFYNGTNWIVA